MASKNIVLVGFMGTGKSSVGRILAGRLLWPHVDVDQRIEQGEKRKIAQIFETSGEAFFRGLEKQIISEISVAEKTVITTGGGALMDPENLEALKRNGWLVALEASPETIYQRVRGTRHRPLLCVQDPLGEIRRLLEIRRPSYQCAEYFFKTDNKDAAVVAEEIFGVLRGKIGTL
jgi:shikimate kinase